MSNMNVSRGGQNLKAGDDLALFLRQFSGEVLTAYIRKTITEGHCFVRSIPSGKGTTFPCVGRVTSEYHTPGAELSGKNVNHTERVINIDGLLVAHTSIPSIDEAMAHYDYSSIYSNEIGLELARMYDLNNLLETAKGAVAAATIPGETEAGTSVVAANVLTDANAIVNALKAAALKLDTNLVPDEERFAYIRPGMFYVLLDSDKIINKLYGENGDLGKAVVRDVANIEIIKATCMPTAVTTANGVHNYDLSKTAMLISHPSAVGAVKLMDLSVETEWLIRNQAWFTVGKQATGHGFLRPEACYEVLSVAR